MVLLFRTVKWVYVDFFGVLTLDDVAVRVDRAYTEALKSPIASWCAGVRRGRRLKGRVGVGGTGLEAEPVPPGIQHHDAGGSPAAPGRRVRDR